MDFLGAYELSAREVSLLRGVWEKYENFVKITKEDGYYYVENNLSANYESDTMISLTALPSDTFLYKYRNKITSSITPVVFFKKIRLFTENFKDVSLFCKLIRLTIPDEVMNLQTSKKDDYFLDVLEKSKTLISNDLNLGIILSQSAYLFDLHKSFGYIVKEYGSDSLLKLINICMFGSSVDETLLSPKKYLMLKAFIEAGYNLSQITFLDGGINKYILENLNSTKINHLKRFVDWKSLIIELYEKATDWESVMKIQSVIDVGNFSIEDLREILFWLEQVQPKEYIASNVNLELIRKVESKIFMMRYPYLKCITKFLF